ncbi:hypothetical protein, partial [Massilia mucilaginosa]|uniref:hypothetical protein n=1 Tax=Massilia mucilaginosa TaxID=2609282 RepID=UPI001CB7060F
HKMRFSAHKMGGKQLGLTSKNASAGIATGDYAGFTGNSRCPEVKSDKAMIFVIEDGSISTAFPFNSQHPH